MTSFISNTTIDRMIQRPDGGHQQPFIDVPDAKHGKNRLHVDLRRSGRTGDEDFA